MDEMKVLSRMEEAAEVLAEAPRAEPEAEMRIIQALALALIARNISRAIDMSGSLTVFTQEA